jgi:hypothetical protein
MPRLALLASLLAALLPACSGGSTRPDPYRGPVTGSASSLMGDDEVLGSASEAVAIEREQAMLDDLARRDIYPETTPCQVTVKYFRSNTTLGLYNESYVSQSDYYTEARRSADYKVISDIKMGALLKSLEDFDYFDEAEEGIKRMAGASVAVVVRKGNQSWTLNWGQVMGEDLMETAHNCADTVRVMYDITRSVQVVDNADGADFFLKERERIQRENALRQASGAVSGGGR